MSRSVLGNLECGGWVRVVRRVGEGGVGRDILDGFVLGPLSKRPLSAISPPIVVEDAPLSHDFGRLARLQSR